MTGLTYEKIKQRPRDAEGVVPYTKEGRARVRRARCPHRAVFRPPVLL